MSLCVMCNKELTWQNKTICVKCGAEICDECSMKNKFKCEKCADKQKIILHIKRALHFTAWLLFLS